MSLNFRANVNQIQQILIATASKYFKDVMKR